MSNSILNYQISAGLNSQTPLILKNEGLPLTSEMSRVCSFKVEKINIRTTKRTELVDITEEIQDIISKSKVKDGICFVFCPHTTAGLTINENADPSVRKDIVSTLNKLVPESAGYSHTEGNADSHIKSSLFGSSLTIFIENSQLAFGTWQGIYFCEGDGPRSREIWVKIIEEK